MLAVAALDVACTALPLEQMLQGPARRFRPHITVMPRFQITDLARAEVCLRGTVAPERVTLLGPRSPTPDLHWYECEAGCEGFAELLAVHAACVALGGDAPGSFSGRSFRPHLTIASKTPSPPVGLPRTMHVRPVAFAIYIFGEEPDRAPVTRHGVVQLAP